MQILAVPRFHPLRVTEAGTARLLDLLRQFHGILQEKGMASIDEYGDMLKWALPSQGDGWCRYFHAYDPGFCSFQDRFRGTVHYHGGIIRGTVLLGHLVHNTYEPRPEPGGDRVFQGERIRLTRRADEQAAGTQYVLPPFVPHWPVPSEVTLTYFEEEDNGIMGDLVDPVDGVHDEHHWEQPDAEAFRPGLEALIQKRIQHLRVQQE